MFRRFLQVPFVAALLFVLVAFFSDAVYAQSTSTSRLFGTDSSGSFITATAPSLGGGVCSVSSGAGLVGGFTAEVNSDGWINSRNLQSTFVTIANGLGVDLNVLSITFRDSSGASLPHSGSSFALPAGESAVCQFTDVSSLADGMSTLIVQAQANVGTRTTSDFVEKDTTAAAFPSGTLNLNGNNGVSAVLESSSILNAGIPEAGELVIELSGTALSTQSYGFANLAQIVLDMTSAPLGSFNLDLSYFDLAGNLTSVSLPLFKDLTSPGTPVVVVNNNTAITSAQTLVVPLTMTPAEAGGYLSYVLQPGVGSAVSGSTQVTGTSPITVQVGASGLLGSDRIDTSVIHTDQAGNVSTIGTHSLTVSIPGVVTSPSSRTRSPLFFEADGVGGPSSASAVYTINNTGAAVEEMYTPSNSSVYSIEGPTEEFRVTPEQEVVSDVVVRLDPVEEEVVEEELDEDSDRIIITEASLAELSRKELRKQIFAYRKEVRQKLAELEELRRAAVEGDQEVAPLDDEELYLMIEFEYVMELFRSEFQKRAEDTTQE